MTDLTLDGGSLAVPMVRDLTDRQRQVLAAVGNRGKHASVSPSYVAKVAGERPDSTTTAVLSQLIKAGLVQRCFAGTMVQLTVAGADALGGGAR